jgi:hypothetical protein
MGPSRGFKLRLSGAILQDDVLLAYQVAFDLVENEMQSFLQQVS